MNITTLIPSMPEHIIRLVTQHNLPSLTLAPSSNQFSDTNQFQRLGRLLAMFNKVT
jgi:hypothetical protein